MTLTLAAWSQDWTVAPKSQVMPLNDCLNIRNTTQPLKVSSVLPFTCNVTSLSEDNTNGCLYSYLFLASLILWYSAWYMFVWNIQWWCILIGYLQDIDWSLKWHLCLVTYIIIYTLPQMHAQTDIYYNNSYT